MQLTYLICYEVGTIGDQHYAPTTYVRAAHVIADKIPEACAIAPLENWEKECGYVIKAIRNVQELN